MARINLGGRYVSRNGEEKYRYWIDPATALMSDLQAVASSPTSDYDTVNEALAAVLVGDENIDELTDHEFVDYSEESEENEDNDD